MKLNQLFAYHPDDTPELRAEKFAILLVSLSCCVAGLIWAAMYTAIFGVGLIAALPLLFVAVVGSSLFVANLTGNHLLAAYAQIACIIIFPTVVQWSIGGILDSGFLLIWALCGPLIALMYFSVIQSALWLLGFIFIVTITVMMNSWFEAHGHPVSDTVRIRFFWMNLTFASIIVFTFAGTFVRATVREREKANKLLLNILPAKTARQLKTQPGTVAEKHERVSVLFADLVGFTRYASERQPEEIVSTLDAVFSRFDELAEHHGLEKIKTIGDAYMVVGGLDGARDHCIRIAHMALDMRDAISHLGHGDVSFSLRIGIHSGSVVAGVIGRSKFAYDLWGDTVNIASRLEATAPDGSIQVSDTVYEAIRDDFTWEPRGQVELRGRGMIGTYCLTGRKAEAGSRKPANGLKGGAN